MKLIHPAADQVEVDRFYELLQRRIDFISSLYGGRLPRPVDLPSDPNRWHMKGDYFFFENGERRATVSAPRVVRIGSHTGRTSTIESRVLAEHSKDWGRPVFRRHLGTALIRRGALDGMIAQEDRERWAIAWYSRVDGWAVHQNPKLLDEDLHPLRSIVTRTVKEMAIGWVEIEDEANRLEFEKRCISLLSNCLREESPIDPPSSNWLGNHALSEDIRSSGLWNIKHVKKRHTPEFLNHFEQYFHSTH